VEQLRSSAADAGAPLVVMAASDPANAYALALPDEDRDPLTRPRGSGALLVTRGGRVVISAEGRGRRLRIAPDVADAELTSAAEALARHIMEPRPAGRRRRDLIVETIDGVRAPASPRASAFAAAGYRSTGTDLRVLAPVG
jgi:ATP-dependent Lhr-like helicase